MIAGLSAMRAMREWPAVHESLIASLSGLDYSKVNFDRESIVDITELLLKNFYRMMLPLFPGVLKGEQKPRK